MATEFIFTHPIIKTIATGLTGFTIGVVSVAGLHSFTGGTLLTNTQTEVSSYVENVQSNINGLSSYLQSNNTTNAEVIKKYQQALDKANENLAELKEHITTSDGSLEAELVALQEKYDKLQASVNQQVQAKVNEVIAQANVQIDAANTASETTYNNVHASLEGGNITQTVTDIKNANPALVTPTDEELQVEGIADIVGIKIENVEDLGKQSFMVSALSTGGYVYKFTFNDGTTIQATSSYIYERSGWQYQSNSKDTTYLPLIKEYFANKQ